MFLKAKCLKATQAGKLRAKKLAIHALASELAKSSPVSDLKKSHSVSVGDIEQAGLGKGSSQRLSRDDPRNHGSRFGWLFGAAVPQKSDKSSLAANDLDHKLAALAPSVASSADQNSTDTSDQDDIDEVLQASSWHLGR